MHTDATRAKISASLKGRAHSAEHKAKIAASLRGRKQSPVTVMRRKVAWRKRLAILRSAGTWVTWSGTPLDFHR